MLVCLVVDNSLRRDLNGEVHLRKAKQRKLERVAQTQCSPNPAGTINYMSSVLVLIPNAQELRLLRLTGPIG